MSKEQKGIYIFNVFIKSHQLKQSFEDHCYVFTVELWCKVIKLITKAKSTSYLFYKECFGTLSKLSHEPNYNIISDHIKWLPLK